MCFGFREIPKSRGVNEPCSTNAAIYNVDDVDEMLQYSKRQKGGYFLFFNQVLR